MKKPIIKRLKCSHPRVWCSVAFVGVVFTVVVFFIVVLPIELLVEDTSRSVRDYVKECRHTLTMSVRMIINWAKCSFSDICEKWKEGAKK